MLDKNQIKMMEADRAVLVERLKLIKDKTSIEYLDLCQTIKAHDIAFAHLFGVDVIIGELKKLPYS